MSIFLDPDLMLCSKYGEGSILTKPSHSRLGQPCFSAPFCLSGGLTNCQNSVKSMSRRKYSSSGWHQNPRLFHLSGLGSWAKVTFPKAHSLDSLITKEKDIVSLFRKSSFCFPGCLQFSNIYFYASTLRRNIPVSETIVINRIKSGSQARMCSCWSSSVYIITSPPCLGRAGTSDTADFQAVLKLAIFLFQLRKCQDCKQVGPSPASLP